jgi:hypothetical protein
LGLKKFKNKFLETKTNSGHEETQLHDESELEMLEKN